ncbi:MAG: AIR carboxylase family protein, partial [Actinomycetota bacterium]|nr:AIR carboxylase family protein [Actinomycetota bacterium]
MRVAVLMGSEKDLAKMQACSEVLTEFGIAHDIHVMSAH